MADKYLVNSADLTSVADAIRNKAGISSSISFPTGFISSITNIQTGAEIKTCTVRFVNGVEGNWGAKAYFEGFMSYSKYDGGAITPTSVGSYEDGTDEFDITLENVVCGSLIYFPWYVDDPTGSSIGQATIEGSTTVEQMMMVGGMVAESALFTAPAEPNAVCVIALGAGGSW